MNTLIRQKLFTIRVFSSRVYIKNHKQCQRLFSVSSASCKAINPKHDNIKSATSVKDLIPSCQCCGSSFHHKDPSKLGFYEAPSETKRVFSSRDESLSRYNNILQNMDPESRKVLDELSGTDAVLRDNVAEEEALASVGVAPEEKKEESEDKQSSDEYQILDPWMYDSKIKTREQERRRNDLNSGLCVVCRTIKNDNIVDISNQPHPSTEEVINMIPPEATIIHTISAHDFPASFIPSINTYASGRKIFYVVTKSDLATDEQYKTRQRFLPYAQDLLKTKYGIDPSRVFAVSGKIGWGLSDLFYKLPSDSYLVGMPNTGKTTLAGAFGSYEVKHSTPKVITQLKQRKVGQTTIPCMTKHPIKYFNLQKKLTDLPSIEIDPICKTFSHIQKNHLRKVAQGIVAIKRFGLPATQRKVLPNNGSVLSLGGLVFIEFEKNEIDKRLVLISWPIIGEALTAAHVFTTIEKAITVTNKPINLQQESWVYINPVESESEENVQDQNENLDNQVTEHNKSEIGKVDKIMDFPLTSAGAEIGILGIGSVSLKLNGPIPESGVKANIYARPGVKVVLRDTPLLDTLRDFKPSSNRKRDNNKSPRKTNNKKGNK